MKSSYLFLAAIAVAGFSAPAHADEFKGQLKRMSYSELISIDVTKLDARQRKTFERIKADREKDINRAYQGTQAVSDPFASDTAIVSSAGLVISGSECADDSTCTVVLRRQISNQCRKQSFNYMKPEYQFCAFEQAHALGGVELPVERLNFDVDSRTTSRTVGMPPACLNCADNRRKVYDSHFTYRESYAVGIPLALLRAASAKGDFAAKLTGRGGSAVVTLDQETLIGFLRKFDEIKGTVTPR